MSSLQRYKKTGGFIQLLSLIETFGPQKKEKFLEMIEAENAVWAKALRDKMLTLERIFTWSDQVTIEVFKNLPQKNLALALEAIKPEQKAKLMVFFSAAEKRRLEDVLTEASPKPEEIAANMVKVIELTRKMMVQGELRAEKFDEGLLIPEDIEAKLEAAGHQIMVNKAHEEPALVFNLPSDKGGHAGGANPAASADIQNMQRTLTNLLRENKALKDELHLLRDKLEAIKRIA